jgi:hypothetical protein
LAKRGKRRSFDAIWNVLTLFVFLLLGAVLLVQVTIYVNPYAVFNPFPPYAMPEVMVLPTPTQDSIALPEVWTATPERVEGVEVATPQPTATLEMTFQEGTPVAEITPLEPTVTPFVGYYSFKVQNAVNAISGEIFKPDLGCNWLGVAGQVFDLQGRPVKGIRVWLKGSLKGYKVDYLGLTLESSPYGPSGFEFTLADAPVNSSGTLYLQLLDQAGIPISDRVYFDTFEDCERNLILINFKQVR